jgi:hypothetical protein
MCNFELTTVAFRQRRLEMIALADERRLAKAMKPVRVPRARSRRRVRITLVSPARLSPSPATR